MNYIYQFLNKNEEIIYVGITQDIKTRIRSQHFTAGGHLPKDCYEEAEMVLYSECLSHDDARIKERYLINKLQPKFNTMMNNASRFNFEIDDFSWKYIAVDRSGLDESRQRTPRDISEYLKFYERKRRHPHGTSQDPEERRLADWAIEFSIRVGSEDHPDAKAVSKIHDFFTWRRGNSTEQTYCYTKFFEITGALPRKALRKGSSQFESRLYNWLNVNRHLCPTNLPEGKFSFLENNWKKTFEQYKKFKNNFDREPRRISTDEAEVYLARWRSTQKTRTVHTIEQANLLLEEGIITKDDKCYKLAVQRARRDELAAQMAPYPYEDDDEPDPEPSRRESQTV